VTAARGPLVGLRVVELASEWTAFAGKLLADLGAEVVLVEPPGGHYTRRWEPFLDDEPGLERSLWWWHYHTSKLGVVLDLTDPGGIDQFRRLVATGDVVLAGEAADTLRGRGIDYTDLVRVRPDLIMVSVTPFGRESLRAHEAVTDLTLLAEGGPVWSCGYDDHTLPPVRGGGNQAMQTGGNWAAIATLVAVLHRSVTGRGQLADVSLLAAANVTTEAATYEWLVARQTVQRQTCRHASTYPTAPTLAPDINGRPVHTGVPPRSPKEFEALLAWLDQLGLRAEFPESTFLEMGRDRGGIRLADVPGDVTAREIFRAGRDALEFIAARLTAYEFFVQGQQRGLAVGIVYAPEQVMTDPHFEARGFPTPVFHEELGRAVRYAGAPFLFEKSPWQIGHRAPRLGEHQTQVLGALRQ